MCDVASHGILSGYRPDRILSNLNQFIYEHFRDTNSYISFIASRIELTRRTIIWRGAGHPSPLLHRHHEHTKQEISSQNTPRCPGRYVGRGAGAGSGGEFRRSSSFLHRRIERGRERVWSDAWNFWVIADRNVSYGGGAL